MTLWVNGMDERSRSASRTRIRSGILPYFLFFVFVRKDEHYALLFSDGTRRICTPIFALCVPSLLHTLSLWARPSLPCTPSLSRIFLVHALLFSFSLWARTHYTPTRRNLYLCKSYKRVLSLGAYLPRQIR